ncbi:hypothetical protein P343_16875 [Sporolactobacillus laevolacticus DSM 442]|uniref:Uncharacterized protein n=1 Tax=Sporolactobacillus laevolacticus DSM 442 TaxID=1395513 RepID=V6IVH9_9BACL|nr:hypothetical protein P343_16875 [Sporolactobacillus laevolacticus DSM 442]
MQIIREERKSKLTQRFAGNFFQTFSNTLDKGGKDF